MKKIAIMGSGNGTNFEAIERFFKNNSEVEITCISDNQDAFILKRAETLGIENVYLPNDQNLEYFSMNKFDLIVLDGYLRVLPKKVLDKMGRVINVHPSLLPAFKSLNAIKDAFLAGVKVSGVSIHWVNEDVVGGEIIAQFPIFIDNQMHYDEFEEEIRTLEHKLYPIVIDKILQDKVFEFQDLMKSTCSSSGHSGCAGGCGGCHK